MSQFAPVRQIPSVFFLVAVLSSSFSLADDVCQCTHSYDTSEKTNIYVNGETTTVSPWRCHLLSVRNLLNNTAEQHSW